MVDHSNRDATISSHSASKHFAITIESILLVETSVFWERIRSNISKLRTELESLLACAKCTSDSSLTSEECILLRFLFRLNSFRMESSLHPLEIEGIVFDIIPSPRIESLMKMAFVAYRTKNTSTGAILIGGLIGSCRKLIHEARVYCDTWSTELQRENADLVHLLSASRRISADVTRILPEIQGIGHRLRSLRAFLWACPFISEFSHPEVILQTMGHIVDTTPEKIQSVKNLFLDDSVHGSKVLKELNRSRRVALAASVIVLCFTFPGIRQELFRQTDKLFSQRIEETCNNLCAAGMRRSGLRFSEWVRCVYTGEIQDVSTDENKDSFENAREKCIDLLRKNSTNAKPSKYPQVFIKILIEIIDISSNNISSVDPSAPTLPKQPDTTPANPQVEQIQEIFPHWHVAFISRILSRYNNNVEKIIDEAFSNNLPPDLQKELEDSESTSVDYCPGTKIEQTETFSLFASANLWKNDALQDAPFHQNQNYDPFGDGDGTLLINLMHNKKLAEKTESLYEDEPEEEMEYVGLSKKESTEKVQDEH
ncbi:hypothetical protein XU18_0397 [Perkinsela sp. CCAP 1560/4]|nr:hypothetical protein XU18_0397 [Perkinsela sp. CCAP 1560/4]|eukprot:KNH09712.1 hypothetical protein XU18_0397 [Perkinsela sp. CCAP 1560/4]